MRLWSLHPRHLDRQGLVACWREALLAQAVLLGRTRGYTKHPQLERFRTVPDPATMIGRYLAGVADEADRRGYRFDRTRIDRAGGPRTRSALVVTDGQLDHEWRHLLAKLEIRSPDVLQALRQEEADRRAPEPHPLMRVVAGPVADWERP